MIIIFFILGLLVGSFLNAFIHRLKTGKSVADGRSQCPNCHHNLSALDLVPILSFILLGGKCRYCHKKISLQYPAIELITAISFSLLVVDFQTSNLSFGLVFKAIFICLFIIIAVYDLKHYLILDKIIFPASVLSLIYIIHESVQRNISIFNLHSPLIQGLFGVLIISGFFGLQYMVSQGRWIGFGDVKLGIFLGLLFGVGQSLMLLMLAYCSGAVVGLLLIAANKQKLSGKLPFGTFLAFSGIIMVLFGQSLIHWYLGLLGF